MSENIPREDLVLSAFIVALRTQAHRRLRFKLRAYRWSGPAADRPVCSLGLLREIGGSGRLHPLDTNLVRIGALAGMSAQWTQAIYAANDEGLEWPVLADMLAVYERDRSIAPPSIPRRGTGPEHRLRLARAAVDAFLAEHRK